MPDPKPKILVTRRTFPQAADRLREASDATIWDGEGDSPDHTALVEAD